MESMGEFDLGETEGRRPRVVAVDSLLLGHLGDLCIMVRLSRANPSRIRLFTQPQFVDFARTLGEFKQVLPFTELSAGSSPLIDLHTTSCQLETYKHIVLSSGRFVQATAARLKWLGVSGQPMRQRAYKSEPIAAYWVRALGLERGIEHLPGTGPISARCIHGTSDCLTLIALQSSTRHKSLGAETARLLINSVGRLTRGRTVLVEGPGRPTGNAHTWPCELDVLRVTSPYGIIRAAESACCMVSIDSGLRHVASLTLLPRIVLYGPTDAAICGSGDGEVPIPSTASCRRCGDPHVCGSLDKYSCLSISDTIVRSVEYQWNKLHQIG